MKASFEHSVDVLVKAYLNNTLIHGNCMGCAVGNLIADACGINVVGDGWDVDWIKNGRERKMVYWGFVFQTDANTKIQKQNLKRYKGRSANEIDSTGYSVEQLARIEYAFETAKGYHEDSDTYMFNGLIAVVDILAEIHGVDLTVKENAIRSFEEIHATK